MMTRNDFELLANALKSERAALVLKYGPEQNGYYAYSEGFRAAVNVVAAVCAANNSRFQRGRFFAACGIDS